MATGPCLPVDVAAILALLVGSAERVVVRTQGAELVIAAKFRQRIGVDASAICGSPRIMALPNDGPAVLRLADGPPSAPTLPPAIRAWKKELVRLKRSPAYQKDGPALVDRLTARFDWQHPGDATSEQIQSWIVEQPWKGSTQNNVLSMLSTFFEFTMKPLKLRRDNPVDDIERAAGEKGDGVREFTQEEMWRIIAAARGHWFTACTMMATTLLRRGAVFRGPRSMRCGYFDRAGRCLEVPPGVLKNRKPQTIPLNDDAMAALEKATANRGHDELIVPILYDEGTFFALLKRANVERYDERGRPAGTHSFRKGGATTMAEAGVHPQTAQHLLGHSDIRLTMKSYTKMGFRHQVEAVKNLGSVKPVGASTCEEILRKSSSGDKNDWTTLQGLCDTDPATPMIPSAHTNSVKPPALAPGHLGSTCVSPRVAGSAEFSRDVSHAGGPIQARPASSECSPTRTRTQTGDGPTGNQDQSEPDAETVDRTGSQPTRAASAEGAATQDDASSVGSIPTRLILPPASTSHRGYGAELPEDGASPHLTGPEKADLLRKLLKLLGIVALIGGGLGMAATAREPEPAPIAASVFTGVNR